MKALKAAIGPKKTAGKPEMTGLLKDWFTKHPPDKKELWICAGIFLLALVVRSAYLYEASKSPTFVEPISDSRGYDDKARALVDGKGADANFFYQAVFYPLFLGLVYLVSNSSIVCAKVIQAVLGALVCVLVYRLGAKAFDRRTGVLAGVMTALYGPLLFFDCELLATGWACLWSVVLVLLFLRSSERPRLWLFLILGICGGLSIITRPGFLVFFVAAGVWLIVALRRAAMPWRHIAARAAVSTAGVLLVLAPVAALSHRATGIFSPLPGSGPINVYIGNNPRMSKTIMIRPGSEWEELGQIPGPRPPTPREERRFFRGRVWDFVTTQPLDWLSGLAYKTVQFVSSREIPRTIDVYGARKYSWVLSALTWKAGRFGFPFGILLPLAFVGLVWCRYRIPAPVLLFVLLWPLTVILVFVAARYRVPVIPVMSVLAAAGFWAAVDTIRTKRWGRTAVMCAAAAVLVLIGLPGPYASEKFNYEAEMYHFLGERKRSRGFLEEAVADISKALKLNPRYADARSNLAFVFLQQGKPFAAIDQSQRALQENDRLYHAHVNWGAALMGLGKPYQAIEHFKKALSINPRSATAHQHYADALSVLGMLKEAVAHYRKAIDIAPNFTEAHNNLGSSLIRLGQVSQAIACYRKALEINPEYAAAGHNLQSALRMRYYQQAVEADPEDAEAHAALGDMFLSMGDLKNGVAHLQRATTINPRLVHAHVLLANAMVMQGNYTSAVAQLEKAMKATPKDPQLINNLAWHLATCPQDDVRDGARAVKLAKQALEQAGPGAPICLDTLAAAYAEQGKFTKAIEAAQKAIGMLTPRQSALAERIRLRLEGYKAGRPHRQGSPPARGPGPAASPQKDNS